MFHHVFYTHQQAGKTYLAGMLTGQSWLCIINNLNTYTHKHKLITQTHHTDTHPHTLLLSKAKNAEISTLLLASFRMRATTPHKRTQDTQTMAHHLSRLFLGPVSWESQTSVPCSLRKLCHRASGSRPTLQPWPHPHLFRGAFNTLH